MNILAEATRNWKTTISGLVGALSMVVVLFFPDYSENIKKIAEALVVIAMALIGIFSRDSDKAGTVDFAKNATISNVKIPGMDGS